jgi:hypothetical protein
MLVVAGLCTWSGSGNALAKQQKRPVRLPPEARIVPQEGFAAAGPDLADPAPDFQLTDATGKPVQLSGLWSDRPVLLVLGSLTSPEFRKTAAGLQELAVSHAGLAEVVLLYTLEAHPQGRTGPYGTPPSRPPEDPQFNVPQAGSAAERSTAARLAMKKLGLGEPLQVLVDGMENAAWNAYGPAPNNAFVIDMNGEVVGRAAWFDAAAMKSILDDLLAQNPKAEPEPAKKDGAEEGGKG